jgi:hypothetical protein
MNCRNPRTTAAHVTDSELVGGLRGLSGDGGTGSQAEVSEP